MDFKTKILFCLKDAGISQEIDPRISLKIKEYASEIKNVFEMRRLLKIYVRDELFDKSSLPDICNRRFFPTVATVRTHMVAARKKLQLSFIDQESLAEKIKTWRQENPNVKIFFRPKSQSTHNNTSNVNDNIADDKDDEDDDSESDLKFEEEDSLESLLFVYQADWQSRLFQRYGGEMLLLDATYKTTRYVLPLFFLVVKTNVDYQIVGTFITENETKHALIEALGVFKKWNPEVKPRYGMTDYCTEEIDSLEETYPGENIKKTNFLIRYIYFLCVYLL